MSAVTEKTFDPVATTFAQQIKDMGCAVFASDSFDPESASYARLRARWIKLCRGDKKMEDAFSKVALMLEITMQPLLDELEAQRRRLQAARQKLMTAPGMTRVMLEATEEW